jgi:small subunit ribosomal protein MRP21
MEFRQVMHSVSRTAAAAARPSLASTRASPAGIVLLQRHRFTTNNKQQLEAAAAVAQPQQTPPPAHTNGSRNRVDKLRASLQNSSSIPPRPPPFRTDNYFEDPQKKKATPTWARPAPKGNSPAAPFGRRTTTLTGRAPTAATGSPSTSSGDSMFNLPSQIQSDMQSTTSGNLGTWNDGDFTSKWYGVTEPELRLRPQTGRTVHVQGNVDLARGFRLLQRAVSQNKIRQQVFHARHHERPALKRKRQKRERWQARFKVGFRATIDRVMELKAQGW